MFFCSDFPRALISSNPRISRGEPVWNTLRGRPLNSFVCFRLGRSFGINGRRCSVKNVSSYRGCLPLILEALDTVEDLDEALAPWREILSSKERTLILKEQTYWKRALEIFCWFRRIGCYDLNVIHYNVLLRILGKARRWDILLDFWEEMQSERIIPTNSTYSTLIDVFSKGGLCREALLWLGGMYKQGMEPDEVTVGIIIQVYKKTKQFLRAEEFFKKWSVSVTNTAPETRVGLRSLHMYNTLIDVYGKAGRLKEASDVFAQMLKEGVFPDRVTFNTMIHVCGSHGHLDEVSSLAVVMEELGCFPDTRTYNILISLYIVHDDISTAINYFSEMKAKGLTPDVISYRMLLRAFSIRNMVAEAEVLVFEMEEKGIEIDEHTQTSLTRMYVNSDMLEKSWSWFERNHQSMTSECFSANIDVFGESGHLILAEKAFNCCVSRKRLSVVVFNVMIKAYGVRKRYKDACSLFYRMGKYGIKPDRCTHICLVQILLEAERPRLASNFVRKMQNSGFIKDCIPYSMVISGLAKLGELKLAETLFKEMIQFGVQPDIVIFSIMINAFYESGNTQQALGYVSLLNASDLDLNSVICNTLIKLYTKVGSLQKAREMYLRSKSMEDGPDVFSSNCMIDLYCKKNMVKEAEEVFGELKNKGEANEFSYSMMLCLYKKLGFLDQAYELAQEIIDRKLPRDVLSYNSILQLFALDGRMNAIAQLFQEMLDSGVEPNDSTFTLLGEILKRRGVSKDYIERLESARRKNTNSGLLDWIKAMCSMLEMDETRNFWSIRKQQLRKKGGAQSLLSVANLG